MYCYYCSYCCFLENMALQKAQFTRLHETELIVYFSCTFNGFFLSWTDAICLPKWLCENSYSHNCHIGMASLRHELQVSVLRKTMRFHSFMFLMCFNINMKAAINSHKLMVGHNLHSNHFVKTAIVKIVTLEGLSSVMNC